MNAAIDNEPISSSEGYKMKATVNDYFVEPEGKKNKICMSYFQHTVMLYIIEIVLKFLTSFHLQM